ncbi:hypothetical protein HPB47_011681 [Ixodes persulcatus]|uniref:Uncharacterized protein n=1 Tax=Ixodes persulcatus TaxID=34615 RepID=A0AC60NVT2_IXOPE|nr:hypothetical protein HPB47_011681 [Ixodes persulcatus]
MCRCSDSRHVPDDALRAVLGPYGKILGASHPKYKDRPTLYTGKSAVCIEMKKAVSNFINVTGHRAMCENRGMKRVCARCGQEGHFGVACRTPLCSLTWATSPTAAAPRARGAVMTVQ